MGERLQLNETDPREAEAMRRIWSLIRSAEELAPVIDEHRHPAVGSAYQADTALCEEYPTSSSVHHLLMAAQGNLAGLRRALAVVETDSSIDMTMDLYGVYELVRGSLETGAWALWLMSPQNPRRRTRRNLVMLREEHKNRVKILQALDRPAMQVEDYRRQIMHRLDAYAERAGIDPWPVKGSAPEDILADAPAQSTRALRYVSALHEPEELAVGYWAAWCMASGMAHGQQWAFHLLHERRELNETTMDALMTGSYVSLHALVQAASVLINTAVNRHVALTTQASPGPVLVALLPRS